MQYRTHMLKDSRDSWLFQVQFLSIVTFRLCAEFPTSSFSRRRLLLHQMCEKFKIKNLFILQITGWYLWAPKLQKTMKLFYSREIHSIQFYSLGKSFTIQRFRSRLSWSSSSFWSIALPKQLFSLRLLSWSLFFHRNLSFWRLPLLFLTFYCLLTWLRDRCFFFASKLFSGSLWLLSERNYSKVPYWIDHIFWKNRSHVLKNQFWSKRAANLDHFGVVHVAQKYVHLAHFKGIKILRLILFHWNVEEFFYIWF